MPRGTQWSEQENEQLCLSWLAVSQDPIKSNDRSRDSFWISIAKHFLEYGGAECDRTPKALKGRWSTYINHDVSKFCGYFERVSKLKKSGTNEDDVLEEAKIMYGEIERSSFRFLGCWRILRDAPKWQENMENMEVATRQQRAHLLPGQDDDTADSRAVTWRTGVGGRPLGQKKARLDEAANKAAISRSAAISKLADAGKFALILTLCCL